jgi:hypothetical protein
MNYMIILGFLLYVAIAFFLTPIIVGVCFKCGLNEELAIFFCLFWALLIPVAAFRVILAGAYLLTKTLPRVIGHYSKKLGRFISNLIPKG